MKLLPSELLIRIFVLLEPEALRRAQRVCKRWNDAIADDRSWRDALANGLGRLPFRRLQPQSWRQEYTERINRIRQWEFDKIYNVEFRPRIDGISHTFIDLSTAYMLAGNKEIGMAVICHTTTGRVEHRHMYASPEAAAFVSSMSLERGRIAWGYQGGAIILQLLARQNRQPRQVIFQSRHEGAVNCMSWSKGTATRLGSGGNDGFVKLWEVSTGQCLYTLYGGQSIQSIQLDTRNWVIAATNDDLLIWQLLDSNNLEESIISPLHRLSLFEGEGPSHLLLQSLTTCIAIQEDTIFIIELVTGKLLHQITRNQRDGAITAVATLEHTPIIVCGYTSGTVALWSVTDGSLLWQIDAHTGPITSLAMDIDKVVSSSIDGRIIVWELLSGTYRCTFLLGRDEEAHVPVTRLQVSSNELLAVFGSKVKSWTIGNSAYTLGKERKKISRNKRRGGAHDTILDRLQLKQEIEEEIEETAQYRASTRREIEFRQALLDKYNSLDDLTEEELLNYTMMLSLEENNTLNSTNELNNENNLYYEDIDTIDTSSTSNSSQQHSYASRMDETALSLQEEQDIIEAIRLSME
ncbi:WD40-repeat-containing domain protein [Syncephalis fuscata]|nr:WD40-repeat-containing domain protein [Syncephalis fuscata]